MPVSRRSFLPGAALALPSFAYSQGTPPNPAVWRNVADYGARGDGTSRDTLSLQAAIDAARDAGGGIVVVPPGRFLTGTLYLRSNVFLHLQPGATLLGSTDLKDYPAEPSRIPSYTSVYADQCLLFAQGESNLGVFGQGVIDGQGKQFPVLPNEFGQRYKGRPYLVRMVDCRGVQMEGISLRDSAMWVQHYLACEDLRIDGITVESVANQNNDGIDIDSCRNVRITGCNILSGDDAIVLKATTERPCENVSVTNCVLSSRCNAFKLGTESNGGFRDIVFADSVIHDTRLSGIAIEMVDGGVLERVNVQNITVHGVGAPLFVRLGNRARPIRPDLPKPGAGQLRNVQISNVQATGASTTGCALSGIPGHPVENLLLRDIRVAFAGGGKATHAIGAVPEAEAGYPEYKMFGDLPAFGIYARHCRGLRMEGLEVASAAGDLRPPLVLDDVEDAEIVAPKLQSTEAALVLWNTRNVYIETRTTPFSDKHRLELQGRQCASIVLREAEAPHDGGVTFSNGASESALHRS